MDYARIAALKLPIGSGCGIDRARFACVVNLRLKGPSIYWHKTTAEAVLLLRSYYKAGRWNHLERQGLTTTTGYRRVSRKKWIAPLCSNRGQYPPHLPLILVYPQAVSKS